MADPVMPNGYTLPQIETCVHRGRQVGSITKHGKCGGCNAANRVTTYKCALHGECTYTRASPHQSQWVCTTCTEVKLPE